MINVAFITLLERKILRFTQLRLGPNKPGLSGLLQPGADAIKLFRNKFITLNASNALYKLAPILALTIALILWSTIPFHKSRTSYQYNILMFLTILRISIYPLILTGWRAKNKYTTIGSIRRIAQTISYEIRLIFVVLSFLITLNFISTKQVNPTNLHPSLIIFPRLFFIWLIILLAETNRTPFDFAEGERELVSGFNTEFRARKFAIIFITEYAIIYLFSYFTSIIYYISFLIFIIFWIWIRATLPRHRYDLLMEINWKVLLPLRIRAPCLTILIFYIYNKILLFHPHIMKHLWNHIHMSPNLF